MPFHTRKLNTVVSLARKRAAFVLVGCCFIVGVAIAAAYSFSDRYSMKIDPADKSEVGERTFDEVRAFFDEAEEAIETKNLEALMSLYSDNYSDGEHDKSSAQQIWRRIFATFDEMATHHNMRFVNTSTEKDLAILRCSGLLLGKPKGDLRPVTIDNWNQQDHMLVKEGGKWKLIGSFGRERKRLWFDKPMHPLF